MSRGVIVEEGSHEEVIHFDVAFSPFSLHSFLVKSCFAAPCSEEMCTAEA